MTRPLSLVISIASISLAVLTPVRAHAESKLCFDMNQPIKTPLKSPISAKAGRDASDSGAFGKKGVWGAARGSVKQPIQEVFQKLLDHYTIKDPEKVKLKVYDQEQNGFMAFHVVMVEAHPLPMEIGRAHV